MKKTKAFGLGFEVDKLTNSIENIATGEVFDTEIEKLFQNDQKQILQSDWQFDWIRELNDKT